MTLEQQLTELIRAHDLLNVSIVATVTIDGGVKFYATAQAEGGRGVRLCAGNQDFSNNAATAVGEAIIALNAKRHPQDVTPLAPMGEAA